MLKVAGLKDLLRASLTDVCLERKTLLKCLITNILGFSFHIFKNNP